MFSGAAIVAWLLKHWYLPVIGLLVAASIFLWYSLKGEIAAKAKAQANYEQAQAANDANKKEMEKLQAAEKLARKLIEEAQEKARARDAENAKLKADIAKLRDADKPAGPFWDDLGGRLRDKGGNAVSG